jgi:cytochrome P450
VVQAITHALFDLAANPEYSKPLREEVEELTKREGWTKAALEQMHKVDSFVKESQRLHPVGICKLV